MAADQIGGETPFVESNDSNSIHNRSKRLQLKPIDQLREEIKGDIRFKPLYEDIVMT